MPSNDTQQILQGLSNSIVDELMWYVGHLSYKPFSFYLTLLKVTTYVGG
jgi:hypothetical protein